MKEKKKLSVRAGIAALVVLCLSVVVVAAGEGNKNDPLITLSYLTETVIPGILEQITGKTADSQEELVGKLDQSIQAYSTKMEELVGEEEGQQSAASYTVVTLTKDQQLKMDIGCEVMLRIGTAQCVSPSNPGLINTTTGTTLNNEGALEVNHLYMATITERAIKATAATTKVLVRGSYTIA